MPTSPTPRIPFDYFDKACLAATNRERGCSGAPIWEIIVEGDIAPERLRDAFQKTLMAHPTARSRVVAEGDRERAKHFFYDVQDRVDLDEVMAIVDLDAHDAEGLEALRRRVWDHYIDPYSETLVRLTYARLGPARGHLFFQQHHGIADGRAFIAFLTHFNAHMQDPQQPHGNPVTKVAEDAMLGLGRLRRLVWTIAGAFITLGTIIGGLFRPIRSMAHNQSQDFSGSNRTLFVPLPARLLNDWKPAARRAGVNANAVLTAVVLRTFARWSRSFGHPPGRTNCVIPAETRPRDGSVSSFANHLASFYLSTDLSELPSMKALMRQVHHQIRTQARRNVHRKKLLIERSAVLGMSMDRMHKLVFGAKRASINIAFSNLIPLDFPKLQGPGWRGTAVRICTPGIPWGGAGVTVVRYGDEVCFNFNYTETAVPPDSMPELVTTFRQELDAAWQELGCPPLPVASRVHA